MDVDEAGMRGMSDPLSSRKQSSIFLVALERSNTPFVANSLWIKTRGLTIFRTHPA